MAYCSMNGVEVKIPMRALRPREPAPPPPSKTMASPLVVARMLRPRTPAEKSLVGVDVAACLERVKKLKEEQRRCEARVQELLAKLKEMTAAGLGAVVSTMYTGTSSPVLQLQREIDRLMLCIKQLSEAANMAAMDAIKGGATQDQVRAAAGESSIERTPVAAPPAAPVIETSTPAVLPDGSVAPGPDAKLTTPDTGKPVVPEEPKAPETPEAGAAAAEKGWSPLMWVAAAGGAWFLWSRMRKRKA